MALVHRLWGVMTSRGLLFFLLYCLGAIVNHVDDTDETYGYFEPLHYLLRGHGMQTWEYAPEFAIRAYSFIAPFFVYCLGLNRLMKALGARDIAIKHMCYFGVKVALGAFTSYSQSTFLAAVASFLGPQTARLSFVLMFFSAGSFYAATAFLPSAVCASLVMLGSAAWMRGHDLRCIFFGAIAVLCTGWPFIGLMFLPLGVYILMGRLVGGASGARRLTIRAFVVTTIPLIGKSLVLIGFIALFTIIVDSTLYGRWTWPTLNIFVYNTGLSSYLGWEGSPAGGDTLYGVEPAMYYIKNLALMLGPSFVLSSIAFPLIMAWDLFLVSEPGVFRAWAMYHRRNPDPATTPDFSMVPEDTELASHILRLEAVRRRGLLSLPAILWLAVMFSRPHKEERFLYPVYPFVAVMAASTLQTLSFYFARLNGFLFRYSTPQNPTLTDVVAVTDLEATISKGSSYSMGTLVYRLAIFVGALVAAGIGVSRVVSSYRNYSGYRTVWRDLHAHTDRMGAGPGTVVCVGGQWDKFPSHFFLPDPLRLAFVKDTFHGELPQLYPPFVPIETAAMSVQDSRLGVLLSAAAMGISSMGGVSFPGTMRAPLQPFNDMNKEEASRYITTGQCDYLVGSVRDQTTTSVVDNPKYAKKLKAMSASQAQAVKEKATVEHFFSLKTSRNMRGVQMTQLGYRDFDGLEFRDVFPVPIYRYVIDSENSSILFRAFYVPTFSHMMNKFRRYFVLQREVDGLPSVDDILSSDPPPEFLERVRQRKMAGNRGGGQTKDDARDDDEELLEVDIEVDGIVQRAKFKIQE